MCLYKLAKTEVTKQFCASLIGDEVFVTPQMVSFSKKKFLDLTRWLK